MTRQPEFLNHTHVQLVDGVPPNTVGSEKIVYKVTDGMHIFAAKIFRRHNVADNSPINRSKRAQEEFTAYHRYRDSTIAQYVPFPVDLIREHNKPVGLLVEWKDGQPIREYYHRTPVPVELINVLEQHLLTLPEDLWIGQDCMDAYNICLGPQGLWFAELMYNDHLYSLQEYRQEVYRWMDILREEYV